MYAVFAGAKNSHEKITIFRDAHESTSVHQKWSDTVLTNLKPVTTGTPDTG
jgi:hypothetical protein